MFRELLVGYFSRMPNKLCGLFLCLTSSILNAQTAAYEHATVLRVIDGDTIDVEVNGERQRVRYIGINTPERNDPCFDEATQANVDLVAGKEVRLERDVSDTDRYGRLLRYVFVNDTFANEALVAGGYAEAVLYSPDGKHYELFSQLEVEAVQAELGCHKTGVFDDGDAKR
jgi:micrococcal nuclease